MVHARCVFVARICSPILDINVAIFGVGAMECMCAHTRPRFTLSSDRGLGNGVRIHVISKGKILSTRDSELGSSSSSSAIDSCAGQIFSPVDATKPAVR